MTTKQPSSANAAALRRLAEDRLRQRHKASAAEAPRSTADTQRLLHELQVHQIELEMQNTELEQTRDRIEILLEKYTDLYDFSPVGYFSLDEQARVIEVNLTGAALLGVERARLSQRGLPQFVAPASQAIFMAFLKQVFARPKKQVAEIALRKADGTVFWANVHGAAAISGAGSEKWCRLTVSDITTLKQAEEAERRVKALTETTRKLTGEITRRQAVEDALRASEAGQRELVRQARLTQEELRRLSHRILHAQEEERRRISRELHDDITQTLIGISVSLEALVREANVNPQGIKRKIAQAQRQVSKSVEIAHRFACDLRPASLDDLGLIPSLRAFMKDFTTRTGIRVHFTTFAGVEQLNAARRTVLYRIVHSALTNTAQHAKANRIDVRIEKRGSNCICLEITDNGMSFDVTKVMHRKTKKHLGLIGMRERVEMVGGELSIESRTGEGTRIRAQIPFRKTHANRRQNMRKAGERKRTSPKETQT